MTTWDVEQKLRALPARTVRLRAAFGGVVAAGASAAVAFTPPSAHGVVWGVLAVSELWTLAHGWALGAVVARERVEALAARWPWMAPASAAERAALSGAWRAAGHPQDGVSWGPCLAGAGVKVRWTWTPVSWPVPGAEPDAQGEVPHTQAWALNVVWDSGPGLHVGRWRVVGAARPGRGWSSVAFAHPGLQRWQVHARDAVRTLRLWSPVAVEAMLAVPLEAPLAIDGEGQGLLCVVPAAWIEGPDAGPLSALVAALRAAVGPSRWDATVGPAWLPSAESMIASKVVK